MPQRAWVVSVTRYSYNASTFYDCKTSLAVHHLQLPSPSANNRLQLTSHRAMRRRRYRALWRASFRTIVPRRKNRAHPSLFVYQFLPICGLLCIVVSTSSFQLILNFYLICFTLKKMTGNEGELILGLMTNLSCESQQQDTKNKCTLYF